jgi:hypothetical protein
VFAGAIVEQLTFENDSYLAHDFGVTDGEHSPSGLVAT